MLGFGFVELRPLPRGRLDRHAGAFPESGSRRSRRRVGSLMLLDRKSYEALHWPRSVQMDMMGHRAGLAG